MVRDPIHTPISFSFDDSNRRQIMNILLLLTIAISLVIEVIVSLADCNCIPALPEFSGVAGAHLLGIAGLIIPAILLVTNRSPRVPFWLTGSVLIVFAIVALAQVDTTHALYSGQSIAIWVIPIMLGAMIFHPTYGFLVAAIVSVMIQVFANLDGLYPHPNIDYLILILFLVAFVSWMATSLAERAVRNANRQSAYFETVLNGVTDGVLLLDEKDRFLFANAALLEMIPETELRKMSSRPLNKMVRWGRKVFTVSISATPETGKVAIFRDQTRCYETENARDALLATVSHEFRTPLTVVLNYIEMLQYLTKAGITDPQAFSDYLSRTLENGQRLQNLVVNILDQAKIQAGMLTVKHQRFDLRDLLEKCNQSFVTSLNRKNLSYKLSIAPNVPSKINGDPDRLRQVMLNLIGNAVKFTTTGSVNVKIFATTEGMLSIEVADTGPGIPEEQLPDIFKAFRCASDYVRREQQGAGLGLSIAKEIVTRMGGQISVSSKLGLGSTFTVCLPLEDLPVAA